MKLKLLCSMAGDNFSYALGDIIDTTDFASAPTEACPNPLSPNEIAEAWIAAGMAEEPKDEEILSADIAVVEAKLVDAKEEATAARELAEEVSAEAVQLRAQVAELTEATGDGADMAKRNAALAADVARLEKLVTEKDASLASVRTTVAAELREQIERDVRGQLDAADPALDAAVAALEASTTSLSNTITAS